MADWYCGTVQHAAITQFAISHAYSVGDIVRPLAAPAAGSERAFRCTTAGTSGGSEAAWSNAKAATTTQGTAVFTEVTGNSTYGWAAAHARLANAVASTHAAGGDRVFLASNDNYSVAGTYTINPNGSILAPVKIIVVNPAGSVPPVAADVTTGAAEASSNGTLAIAGASYIEGVAFSCAGTSNLNINGGNTEFYFKNCAFTKGGTTGVITFQNGGAHRVVTWDNCTVTFSNTANEIRLGIGKLHWKNTPAAIGGATFPTNLFGSSDDGAMAIVEGVDLSALGSGKNLYSAANVHVGQLDFINCRIDSAVGRPTPTNNRGQKVRLLGCSSGAGVHLNEIHAYEGDLTTETTIVRSTGASDGVTPVSWKVVTTATPTREFPFDTFPIAEWNATTGSSVTATVEIVTDGVTLTDAEAWIEVEYLGNGSYPLASGANDGLATPLTAAANQTTSTETWTTTGLASPVKQKLSVNFTPQMAGLVRAVVKIAKISTTLYLDPKLTLT